MSEPLQFRKGDGHREAMMKELKALQAEFRELRKQADEKEAKIQELIRQIDLSRTPEPEPLFEDDKTEGPPF